jgi:iron complex transport system ATP-binding protein
VNPAFQLKNVTVQYGKIEVLNIPSLDLAGACFTAIVGPNGAGKSTLLSVLSGLRTRYGGHCSFQGSDVHKTARRTFAKNVSFIPQTVDLHFPFTGEQVVLMGRTPYCDGLFETEEDWKAVEEAMRLTDTLAFRDRDFRTLSGGEKQRVVLASALAQTPSVLLLDEPTTYLDLKHQLATYKLLSKLANEGMLVVAVTHDINLAAAFSDRVIMLDKGCIKADGKPAEVINPQNMRSVFGVEVQITSASSGHLRVDYTS